MRGLCSVLVVVLLLLTEVQSDNVWRLCDNGTYVKVFDKQDALEGSGDGDTLIDDEENNDDSYNHDGHDWSNSDDEDLFDSSGDTESPVPLVIPVEASVRFEVLTKQINLGTLNCRLRDGTRVPCVQVTVRIKYRAFSVPHRLSFVLDFELDARKRNNKRMFLLDDEGVASWSRSVTLLKNREWRERFNVYIPQSPDDKLTPLHIKMNYRPVFSTRY